MKSIINTILLIFILLFVRVQSSSVSAQTTENTQQKLNRNIEELKNDNALKHASIGIYIKNISTGNIIYELNPELSLTPASVMKIPSTIAALSILGKDYKFKTTLGYSGNIDVNGMLNGDIYITGSGDPTFGSSRCGDEFSIDSIYYKFYRAIVKAGIKKIKGSVIADGSIFDDEIIPQSWQWDDMGNYYGAGACGLNINENLYSIVFKPGKVFGDNAIASSIKPDIPYLNIINKATTGKAGTGDNVIIYGSPYSTLRLIKGTVPIDKEELEVKGSFHDPAYFCAYSFHNFLVIKNIIPDERPSTVRNIKLAKKFDIPVINVLTTHLSPALNKIVIQTNLNSINSYAEALLKATGYAKLKDGSTKAGIEASRNFWKAKSLNIDGLVMNDGSGLSPTDKITVKLLSQMLEYALTDNKIKAPFINSLPLAGVSGSIRKIFKSSAAENNLKAKSGYMNAVRAYAGCVKNKKDEQIVFSIIVNNYNDTAKDMKSKLEKIMISIAELE